METDALGAIRHLINLGDREGARRELAGLLKATPDNADAWALLAIVLKDPAEQAECYRQILRIRPEDRQAAAWLAALSRQMPEVHTEEGELGRLLEGLDLPERDDDLLTQVEQPRVATELHGRMGDDTSEVQHKEREPLDGLLDQLGTRSSEAADEALLADGIEDLRQASPLSPGVIIRLAGGPLPATKRRTCPKCGAVVARDASRCPWCSAPLPAVGDI